MRLINALETGDRVGVNEIIKGYKTKNGAVNYPEVLQIPVGDRICGLISAGGYKRVHIMLSAGIQLALESLNLSRGLSPAQIVDLSDIIIDSATEDNLGIEDVVLFLQKLVRGESGTLYNSIDIAKFMEAFEDYRDKRHKAMLDIRYEREQQYQVSGRTDRIPDFNKESDPKTMADILKSKYENQQGTGDMAGSAAS